MNKRQYIFYLIPEEVKRYPTQEIWRKEDAYD